MLLLSTACLPLRSPPLRRSERLHRRATCFQLGPAPQTPPRLNRVLDSLSHLARALFLHIPNCLPTHLTPDLRMPRSAAIGPVRLPRMKANASAPGLARKTTASFADLPAALGDPVFADFKFRLTRPDAPANARFRVAIDEGGAIRF